MRNLTCEIISQTIRGKTQPYKRVSLSPLRYAGGKSNAVGLILEHLPRLKEKKIVSLFFGGGSVELVLSSQLGFQVIGYDVFSILVNFWDQVLHQKEAFLRELAKLVPNKTHYTHNRQILMNYWNKVKPPTLVYTSRKETALRPREKTMLDNNPLLQAVYYYYNTQLSYGPMFLGWPSSVYLQANRYEAIIERLRHFQAGNLDVRCASFEVALDNHPDDFLFLDPPYYLGEDSKMKGMYPNCNFAIHHNDFPHELLRDMLLRHKGGFFLTYNDCPTIRQWYSSYQQIFPKWQYTFGQGEKRIGKNRGEGQSGNVKDSHEIFIICPPGNAV